jgi:predicted Zn-dependent peptidase
MKKVLYIAASLFLTITMQAQDRSQPKPGPAPTINIGKPSTFTLPNGLKVLVVENHKLPRVSFSLSMDNPPYTEGNKKGVADLTSSLIGNGTKKMPKDAFNEEVDFLGADISFYSEGANASGLSKYAGRILELMADGALNPIFSQVEFDKEKQKLIESLKADEKNVKAVAGRVESVLAYGRNNPSGEYLTEETINNVTLKDVENNYNTYFVPGNAYLVVVGDVKLKEVEKTVKKLFGNWKKGTAPTSTYTEPKNVANSQINLVDMPNAVQSEISLVNTVNLKMTDKEYFASILANQILGGGGEGRLFLNLREKHGWTYGAYSSIGSGKYTRTFSCSASVRNAVTDSAVVEFMNELRKIRTEKVTDEELKNAKAKYIGGFVMQIQKPGTVARYALTTETQPLPADFYENYIKNINAVTPEDIKNAANKFFLAENIRVVVVGKAADVLPGLEKMGAKYNLPVYFFDKFGNPTEKPAINKALPAGVTSKSVLDNYIKAIGGEKAVNAVKTIKITGTTSVPGAPAPLTYTSKTDAKGKTMTELTMGTMSMMKQVVNDKEGYIAQQGQKMKVEGDKLSKMKAEAVPFKELNLSKSTQAKVTGIESVNGNDAYVIESGSSKLFFDTKSGLKVAESETQEAGGQKMTATTYFSDYKDVKGVKVPFTIVMNVGIELNIKVSDVKINEGVSDADFL